MNDSPALKTVTPTVKRLQIGLFGKLFGDKDHAPGNIAGATVIIGALLIILSICVSQTAVAVRLLEIGSAFTCTSVAYLFGRSSR